MIPNPRNGQVGKIRQRCTTKHLQVSREGSAQVCFTSFTFSQCGQKLQARPVGSPPSHHNSFHSFVVAKGSLPATSRRAGRVASTLLMRFLSPFHSPLIRSSFRSCVMSAQLSETDRRQVENFLPRCGGHPGPLWQDLW